MRLKFPIERPSQSTKKKLETRLINTPVLERRQAGLRADNLVMRMLHPLASYVPQSPNKMRRSTDLPRGHTSHTKHGKRSLVVAGTGTPTVVFEAGLGKGKEVWGSVFNEVAAQTRAVAYDRAGYGDSEPAKSAREPMQLVRELRAMLAEEGIAPPYVLVGHSLGGTIMKLFARAYPHEIAGVVLVDARHSDFARRCKQVGMPRFLYEPPAALFLLARAAMRGELAASTMSAGQARKVGPFPSVPLVVLTQNKSVARWPKSLGRLWVASQRNMVRMSKISRMEVCDDAGHNLHKDRPDAVVKAVLNVVRAARFLQEKSERRLY
jgi:pimeloyl-ACP methyl ester carboxylesterase